MMLCWIYEKHFITCDMYRRKKYAGTQLITCEGQFVFTLGNLCGWYSSFVVWNVKSFCLVIHNRLLLDRHQAVSNSVLVYCQSHPHKQTSEKFESKYKNFHSWKCMWKYLTENRGHFVSTLTHWGRVTQICVGQLTNIGSDNGLSPGRRQAIIWTNAGILLIGPLGTCFSEFLIVIHTFSFNRMHLKMSSAIWHPFCLGLNVLIC